MKKVKLKNKGTEFTVGKIVCVGRNYVKHAEELGNETPEFPLIFLKPSSVLAFSGEAVVHPDYSSELHYEAELVLLIKNRVKNAVLAEASEAIGGYGVGLDMTLRDVQNELKKKGHPWTLAKCFDSSAVVSDFISTEDYSLTLEETIKLYLNGEPRQNEKLKKMIFKPAEIVKYISSKMTLEPGDLIFTGTPAGVGKTVRGDKLVAEIENIGLIETIIK